MFDAVLVQIPVLCADASDEGGNEDECGYHGGHGHRGSDQCAADRYRGAAVTGFEGHRDADAAGHRPSHPERDAEARLARRRCKFGHAERTCGPGGGTPSGRAKREQRQQDDGREAETQDGGVDLEPGIWLGQPGRPNRRERGGSDRHDHRRRPGTDRHQRNPGQRHGGEPGPGRAECAQDGEVHAVKKELAAE
jgi:hypothetical protein